MLFSDSDLAAIICEPQVFRSWENFWDVPLSYYYYSTTLHKILSTSCGYCQVIRFKFDDSMYNKFLTASLDTYS